MNKKVSLGVTISLVAIACAITFVLTMTVSLNMYNSMVTGVQERENINQKMKEIDSFVRANAINEVDENVLINSIMNGYISGIDDEYARYYPADDYYQIKLSDSGVIVGVGMETEASGNNLKVTKVIEGSSADIQSIKKGFTIKEIDGKTVAELGIEAAQKAINGDEGTKVILKIDDLSRKERTVTLIRQSISIKSVIGKKVNGYAVIKITTFNETTADQFLQLIDQYESEAVLGYIFDVRGNSGGLVAPLSTMLSRIMPEAVVATAKYADGTEKNLIETDGATAISKPMVVLANKGTASAGELFAVALKDFNKAYIVGSTTFGKAVMQTTQSFKDGSAVSISTSHVYPTVSPDFNKVGIVPDYVVEMSEEQYENIDFNNENTDAQLLKALESIATKK